MKAPPFSYVRPHTLEEALALAAHYGEDARFLAGGQSLMPLLQMRLTQADVLIDINALTELQDIRVEQGTLRIGALNRHEAVRASPLVARYVPLLALAMPHVAHLAVRHRGTLGGSVALADPAAEIPAVCLTLGADMEIASPDGRRRVSAEAFFLGPYMTVLAPDEILVAVHLPLADGQGRAGFTEQARRHGDYAVVGLCAWLMAGEGRVTAASLGVFGVGGTPLLAPAAAACLLGGRLSTADIESATAALAAEIEPLADLQTSAAAKRHLLGVHLGRVLHQMRGSL